MTVFLARFLTKPILDLTRVTAQMSAGDLSQQGHNHTGPGRDRDPGRIIQFDGGKDPNYTSNLENLVEIRTRDLMESREKYRSLSQFLTSILESTTQYGIIAMDMDGTITEFNKGAEKTL